MARRCTQRLGLGPTAERDGAARELDGPLVTAPARQTQLGQRARGARVVRVLLEQRFQALLGVVGPLQRDQHSGRLARGRSIVRIACDRTIVERERLVGRAGVGFEPREPQQSANALCVQLERALEFLSRRARLGTLER